LDLGGLAHQSAGTRYAELASAPELVKQFGTRLGVQLVSNGKLLQKVHTRLLSSFDGQLGKLDGLVVMRSNPSDLSPADAQTLSDFQTGLLAGVTASGIPTVGVELSTTDPSQVSWYRSQDIASVDDLDKLAGRTALVFALTGAQGSYGIKSTADSGLLPRVSTPAQP
jgi:hypothetical protein